MRASNDEVQRAPDEQARKLSEGFKSTITATFDIDTDVDYPQYQSMRPNNFQPFAAVQFIC